MDIKDRAFEFSVDMVQLCQTLHASAPQLLPRMTDTLLLAGTNIATHVEEAHGSGKADFIAHMQAAAQSARQVHYWLRLLQATRPVPNTPLPPLIDEAQQLAAILSSIVKTAKKG